MVRKLPYDVFLKTFENVPRLALNLAITDKQNRILLTKRANPPFKSMWHFPGGFLLKGELLNDCLVRIAKDELGLKIKVDEVQLLGVFEDLDMDPRGHIVDIMYGYKVENLKLQSNDDSDEAQFFDQLPENIGFNHRETLEKLGYK